MTADELRIEPGAIWPVEPRNKFTPLTDLIIDNVAVPTIMLGEGIHRVTWTGEIIRVDRDGTLHRGWGTTSPDATNKMIARENAERAREEYLTETNIAWGRGLADALYGPPPCQACNHRKAASDEIARDCIDLPSITTTANPKCEKHR